MRHTHKTLTLLYLFMICAYARPIRALFSMGRDDQHFIVYMRRRRRSAVQNTHNA